MSKRQTKCVVLLGLATILVGICIWQVTKGWTPDRARRAANADVPLGSNAAQATSWLQANGFTVINSGSTDGLRYFETRDHISLMGATDFVYGYAPNPNVGPFCEGRITVFFFLTTRIGSLKHMCKQQYLASRQFDGSTH
jgi:hypothetical protein